MSDLLPLESEVLKKLLRGDDPVLSALRNQLNQARMVNRQFTEKGFFVDFTVNESISLSGKPDFTLGDVGGTIPELENGVGFVLFVKHGVLAMLEGYCYGERWPDSITTFDLKYIKAGQPSIERDLEFLKKELPRTSGI